MDGSTARAGAYEIGELLGSGGFGEVYRAKHPVIGREVAIKVLHAKYSKDAEAVARFVAEGKAVNQISHPGIVEIFDFGELPDGRAYCVMELVQGKTLRDVLRERGKLPLDDAMPILRAMAEAIDAAHAAGIAHRDLKPDNVFVTDDGVKIIDFGLAKLTREDTPPITETGAVFGTPLYMSPEQCRGKRITTATDAYSFGALAYHLLVGEPPFSGEAIELALHHLNDQPPSTKLGDRVDRVVLALMAKDPAQRPPKLADAIAAIAGDAALPAKPRGSRKWLLPAAAALAVAAAGSAFYLRGCVAPVDDCVAPATRLAGIWDDHTRETARAKFAAAHRPDVDATFRGVATLLDSYTQEWSRQWVSACHAPDRTTDPLLYAQRTTCLENALIAVRGFTDSIADAEVVSFAAGFNGEPWFPALADCESTPTLRAQPPAPPPELRAKVDGLVAQVHRARAEVRAAHNAGHLERIDNGLATLRDAANQLDALDAPATIDALFWLGFYEVDRSRVDPKLLPEAEQVVARTTKRAIELRNDPSLPFAYSNEVELARRQSNDAEIDAAFARWAAANARAGNPKRALWEYWRRLCEVETDRGRFDAARSDVARLAEVAPQLGTDTAMRTIDELSAAIEERSGHLADSVKFRRRILDRSLATWGPDQNNTLIARHTLASTLALLGDAKASRDELRALLASYQRVNAPQVVTATAWTELLARSVELGDAAAANEALAKVDELEQDLSWPRQIADEAFRLGRIEVAAYALGHADHALAHASPQVQLGLEEWRAYLAFMRGDYAAIVAPATHCLELEKQLGPSSMCPVLLGLAEAHHGRIAQAVARVPLRVEPPPGAPEQVQLMVRGGNAVAAGMVYDAAGRWKDAITSIKQGLDVFAAAKLRTWDIAEAEAFYGDALVHAGDAKAAIAPLEDALAITNECCHGFHYYMPIVETALATALRATGGDPARAQQLEQAAADHRARLAAMKE